MTLQKKAENKR